MTANSDDLDRRDALKLIAGGLGLAALGGTAACAPATSTASSSALAQPRPSPGPAPERFLAAPPMDTVRIGFVGVGGQGTAHVHNLLRVEGCVIKAVDDIVPEKVTKTQDLVEQAGFPRPTGYSRGPTDFVRMCEQEELDLVFNATPWEWHVPICLAAMRNGKHTATEVPAAYTVDDCWALVEHAERYGKHCVMMENCNYGRMEMMVFNMVRQGVFGEILHAEGGYLHDLRSVKFSPEGEGLWRRAHAMKRNGNLYPTHGLGPVANCMDVNRGDRFATLVSMSSPSRGLELYAREHFADGSPQRQERYVLGDVNWSLIMTANGRTIAWATIPTCRARTAECTWSRAPAVCFRATRTASTSKGGASRTTGSQRRHTSRSSITRCGSKWKRRAGAPGMAAWTTSRTIGSSSACAKGCPPT